MFRIEPFHCKSFWNFVRSSVDYLSVGIDSSAGVDTEIIGECDFFLDIRDAIDIFLFKGTFSYFTPIFPCSGHCEILWNTFERLFAPMMQS